MSATRDTSKLTPQQIQMLNTALFEQWSAQIATMKASSETQNIDPKNIRPEDIGVSFGPVMDESTFKKYQEQKNKKFTVMKAEDLAKMFGKK